LHDTTSSRNLHRLAILQSLIFAHTFAVIFRRSFAALAARFPIEQISRSEEAVHKHSVFVQRFKQLLLNVLHTARSCTGACAQRDCQCSSPQSALLVFTAAEMDALEFRQMLREGDNALESICVLCCKQVTTSQDDCETPVENNCSFVVLAAAFACFFCPLFWWSIA
jgi:hypothetical protein